MSIPFTKFDGLFIDGAWVSLSAGQHEDVINPATEEAIGRAPVGTLTEARAAIDAARRAFDHGPWPRLPQAERTAMMRRLHTALLQRAGRLIPMMVAEGGFAVPLAHAMQFQRPMELFAAALERSLQPTSRTLPVETAMNPFNPTGAALIGAGTVVREPAGVVTAITAYNAPLLINLSKIVPALLAGCTVILKPSPYTPFSALLFGELALEIGLPPGVLNVVTGDAEVAQLLTSDAEVDMVTFTGSEGVGAAILAQAAPTIKKVLLELGGKSALIVRADAAVQKAAREGVFQVANHCGQGCALATRHIVHNSIRPAYVAMMQAIAGQIVIGNPADPTTQLGPLIRAASRDKVERMVQMGRDEGARLVCGGSRPAHMQRGFFYDVTVFDDVDNRMRIAQDEVFGPVASVIGFDTDEEVVRLANDSRYGLYGGIHSRDPAKAWEMALQLRTGGVIINGGLYRQNDAPFGGYKRSGLGREYGDGWLHEYTQEKAIVYPIGL